MHEHGSGRGARHQSAIHLISRKHFLAAFGFPLLTHRRPYVRIHRVYPTHRLRRFAEHADFEAIGGDTQAKRLRAKEAAAKAVKK